MKYVKTHSFGHVQYLTWSAWTCGKQFATPSEEATDLGFSAEHHRRLSLKGQSFRLVNSGRPGWYINVQDSSWDSCSYLNKLTSETGFTKVKLANAEQLDNSWAMGSHYRKLPLWHQTSNLAPEVASYLSVEWRHGSPRR